MATINLATAHIRAWSERANWLLEQYPLRSHIGHKRMNDQASGPAPRSVGPAAIEDLVAANHSLADQGVLDGYGHVTMRHPHAPDRYFLSRSKAPAIIASADIM